MIPIITIEDREKIQRIKRNSSLENVIPIVKPIIEDVKINGDKAVIKYTKKFDQINPPLQVTKKQINQAYQKTNKKTISTIKKAIKNIKKYAELQLPKEWIQEISEGIFVGQIIRSIEKVGCYVPGGNFPLVSTVLMTVIPAKVAGVKEIIICSPKIQPEVIVAADICGVNKIFNIGGVQAIAAMAYGTESVPKVDKIVGPGNLYVTTAKKLVYGDVGIDFLAGPSEIMIIADEKSNPKFIAADMLAQAEHDKMASAILVTDSKEVAKATQQELKKQLQQIKTKQIAEQSLKNNCAIILVKDLDEAFKIANEFAPEHLEIMSSNKALLKKVQNAGSVFLGENSPEAAGDYCSGPNAVLPTAGTARIKAGLSVLDFVKIISVQKLTKKGLANLKPTIIALADMETLDAHKKSVLKRFGK